MKKIGFTPNGGLIVEMSKEESVQFEALCFAVEGRDSFPTFDRNSYASEPDLSTVFGVIRTYYEHRFAINRLKSLLEQIEGVLNK